MIPYNHRYNPKPDWYLFWFVVALVVAAMFLTGCKSSEPGDPEINYIQKWDRMVTVHGSEHDIIYWMRGSDRAITVGRDYWLDLSGVCNSRIDGIHAIDEGCKAFKRLWTF